MSRRPKSITGTFILAGVVALILGQVHGGFMLVFVLAVFTPWLVYSGFKVLRNRHELGRRSKQAGVWIGCIGVVFGLHVNYHISARAAADLTVESIANFHEENGRYPSDVGELGESALSTAREWSIRCGVKDGTAYVVYPATHIPFDTFWYRFSQPGWKYQSS